MRVRLDLPTAHACSLFQLDANVSIQRPFFRCSQRSSTTISVRIRCKSDRPRQTILYAMKPFWIYPSNFGIAKCSLLA